MAKMTELLTKGSGWGREGGGWEGSSCGSPVPGRERFRGQDQEHWEESRALSDVWLRFET